MSVPTHESIYRLIPPPAPRLVRPPRHKSRFSDTVREDAKFMKSSTKTMGPAKVQTNKPGEFLKKRSNETKLAEKTVAPTYKQSHSVSDKRKPRVPPHTEQPQLAGKTTKNFVTTNAIANITTVPKKPSPKYVDDPSGASHNLETSGLVPKFVHKKEYGKVPTYLDQRKREMAEAQAEYDRHVRECLQRGQMQQLSVDERNDILEGLKKNWDKLHHEYQGLSVVTDTPAKKAHKERIEAEMKQLEKDIELIERHPVIYIGNND